MFKGLILWVLSFFPQFSSPVQFMGMENKDSAFWKTAGTADFSEHMTTNQTSYCQPTLIFAMAYLD